MVECTALEMRRALAGTVGSNPTLSATSFAVSFAPFATSLDKAKAPRMASYKEPTFQDRAALSADAKQRALEKLKAKPPVDPAVLAARAAAREAKEAAEVKKREEKKLAIEQARLDKLAKAEAAEQAIKDAEQAAVQAEIDKKAARDARYAARKAKR